MQDRDPTNKLPEMAVMAIPPIIVIVYRDIFSSFMLRVVPLQKGDVPE